MLSSPSYPATALSLTSATLISGKSTQIGLSKTGDTVAGLEWTLNYPAADFTSVNVVGGPAAAAAGKIIACQAGVGNLKCVAVGMNSTNIASGVVALVNLTAPAATAGTPDSRTANLILTNSAAVSPAGASVPATSTNATVTIVKAKPSTISPSSISMRALQTQQFTTDTAVIWSLTPGLGTISSGGLYTAPASIASAQAVTVRATSTADPATSVSATIHLTPVTIQVSPLAVQLLASQTVQFTAPVTDAANTSVTWSIAPNVGAISTSGLYTAPTSVPSAQVVIVTAASVADPSATATATLTLISNGVTTHGLSFKPITPCRLMETRPAYNFEGRTGSFGPPFLNPGETRTLPTGQSNTCDIPASARALMLNVTLVPDNPVDFVTIWQTGAARPSTWTIRSPLGHTVANSAIVQLGNNGGIDVYSSSATNILIDVSGYFTNDPLVSNLVYYPMNPCRVVETRADYRPQPGPFGPPSLGAQSTRRFRFPESPHCSIPANAAAYSVTMTVVPSEPLVFLTAWPAGTSRPNVSNINSPLAHVLANSVIIPAGEQGAVDVFAYNQTDLLVDINGYFAPDDGSRGLYYFPIAQCRVVDTTNPGMGNLFGTPAISAQTARTVPLRISSCGAGVPSTVKGYAINLTALPNGQPLPFITAYGTGEPRPNISQLNAFEGQIVSNSAIVSSGVNGSIDVYAYRQTNLVMEVSGYFGR